MERGPVPESTRAENETEDDLMPICPTCGKSDMVEESVDPDNWDGYCYRCQGPFNV
jgi:hypothetical protein